MVRKLVSGILSVALLCSTFVFQLVSSAAAAELISPPLHGTGLYDSAGVSANIHYKIPFGGMKKEEATPYLGLSLNATKAIEGSVGINDKYSVTRPLADIRFTSEGFSTAKIAGVTMLNADGNTSGDIGGGNGWMLWLLVIAAAGVGVYLLVDDDNNESTPG